MCVKLLFILPRPCLVLFHAPPLSVQLLLFLLLHLLVSDFYPKTKGSMLLPNHNQNHQQQHNHFLLLLLSILRSFSSAPLLFCLLLK